MLKRYCISSGHGWLLPGAIGILNEVHEARRVVDRVTLELTTRGHEVVVFHDNDSTNVPDNINAIVRAHRATGSRCCDVSVHFNAFDNPQARGVETLYLRDDDEKLASRMSHAIAKAGDMPVRQPQGGATLMGAQRRGNLGFLAQLRSNPTILLEVCFVTSQRDADAYNENFEAICVAIADELEKV